MEIQELPPSSFRFGNYNADIPFSVFLDDRLLIKWMLEHNILGYCKKPEYKPIDGYIAVLFNLDEHGEYWSHIPERVFNKLINF